MRYNFKTQGVCSRTVSFDMENGIVSNVAFEGGCNGNLKGISALCKGMKIDDVIAKLQGIKCGFKNTSCPDQFAKALCKIKAEVSD